MGDQSFILTPWAGVGHIEMIPPLFRWKLGARLAGNESTERGRGAIKSAGFGIGPFSDVFGPFRGGGRVGLRRSADIQKTMKSDSNLAYRHIPGPA